MQGLLTALPIRMRNWQRKPCAVTLQHAHVCVCGHVHMCALGTERVALSESVSE